MSAWTIRIEAETDASAERALRQALKSLPLAEDDSAPYRLEINSEDVSDGAFEVSPPHTIDDSIPYGVWVHHKLGAGMPCVPSDVVDVEFDRLPSKDKGYGVRSYRRRADRVAWSRVKAYRIRFGGGE